MAQYKVPQDVEAEDKLIGPFNFRQFVYLLIIGFLLAIAYLLFRIFPLLCIIPLPPILLLGALALPIKKDQPMETYLSAVISFYLKPRTRTWEAGEPESTIIITAPKKKEEARTKNLDETEALHRLSFLADIVDTEGYAIKGTNTRLPNQSAIKDEIVAEASNTRDIFETTHTNELINQNLKTTAENHHQAIVNQMRTAIANHQNLKTANINHFQNPQTTTINPTPPPVQSTPPPLEAQITPNTSPKIPQIIPDLPPSPTIITPLASPQTSTNIKPINPDIINLANNSDLSVETIAKEAKRINDKQNHKDEVYISLH